MFLVLNNDMKIPKLEGGKLGIYCLITEHCNSIVTDYWDSRNLFVRWHLVTRTVKCGQFLVKRPGGNVSCKQVKAAMLYIMNDVTIPDSEIELSAVRSQGPGGQNVNNVSTAIHLRFNIQKSSLPDAYKARLLNTCDYRISSGGIIIIKAQRYRSQEQNKEDALKRLARFIKKVNTIAKQRKKTKPSKQAVQRRLDSKAKLSALKKLRKLPIS